MKKIFFLASALAVLAACNNNDELPVSSEQPEAVVFDLNALSYEGVMTRLSETNSLKDVTLVDGEAVKKVSELKASENVDAEQAQVLNFFSVNTADSVDMTVTPDYIAIRSTVAGNQTAYIVYADGTFQKQLADFYEQLAPATRNGEPIVTRGANNQALKLNLTGLYETMKAKTDASGTYEMEETLPVLPENAATRGWFSNLFKKVAQVFAPAPVVRTATVDIYLMKERGANPLNHEMNWQVNDAISSLKDVQGNVKFNVYIRNCDYRGNNNGSNTLSGFRNWVNGSSYRSTNGVFFLCRWGGWSDALGVAYVSDYNVNNDLKAYGVSATNAWNKFTMAHEMGHNFGANHVKANWWQLFTADLMSATSFDFFGSGKHKDSANRAEIKKRLTLN